MDRREFIKVGGGRLLSLIGLGVASAEVSKAIAQQPSSRELDGDIPANWPIIEREVVPVKGESIVERHHLDSEYYCGNSEYSTNGRPARMYFDIILPPDYYKIGNNKMYGVVYLHCGGSATTKGWGKNGGCNYWSVWCRAPITLDHLRRGYITKEDMTLNGKMYITEDELRELNKNLRDKPWEDLILVCTWNTSTATGDRFEKYKDYFFDELIPYVENNFRVIRDRKFRATDGACNGAAISMLVAMEIPEMFAYVGGIQTNMGNKLNYYNSLTKTFTVNRERIKEAGGMEFHFNTNEGDRIYARCKSNYGGFMQLHSDAGMKSTLKVFKLCTHGYNAYRFPNGHESFYFWGRKFRENRMKFKIKK